ncbi:MAG TPA: hypothetical protein VHZ25_17765 [Acidobacteriaceae bacterium]|jgi:hypothetical protein|nr:hypothetical protein [Acidobacteriaceae bacterium]
MAGTAKGYDISAIHQGPGDLWIIGTPPTDTTQRLTLNATDGTPDATAHPASVCLGTTESGITFTIKVKAADIKVDQAEAPVDNYLEELDASIEAELSQQSVDLLQNALTTGVYSTASGYKQLTFGGISIVPSFAIAAITPKRTGTNLYIVSLLYKCNSKGGLTIMASRSKKSTHKVQFTGLADLARTVGRQIGVHYETLT